MLSSGGRSCKRLINNGGYTVFDLLSFNTFELESSAITSGDALVLTAEVTGECVDLASVVGDFISDWFDGQGVWQGDPSLGIPAFLRGGGPGGGGGGGGRAGFLKPPGAPDRAAERASGIIIRFGESRVGPGRGGGPAIGGGGTPAPTRDGETPAG